MKHVFETLLSFLSQLKDAHIAYSLKQVRDETIMVVVTVPSQIWEVEFFHDGAVEVEVFKSNGEVYDEKKMDELFANFSD